MKPRINTGSPNNNPFINLYQFLKKRTIKWWILAIVLCTTVIVSYLLLSRWAHESAKARKAALLEEPWLGSVANCNENAKYQHVAPRNVKFLLYVIYHDATSERAARIWCECRPWARPIFITSTKFFESIVYKENLPSLAKEWESFDYVGLATYRSVKELPMDKLVSHLRLAICCYEVVPLLNGHRRLLEQAIAGHNAQFSVVWEAILSSLGYNSMTIQKYNDVETFWRNSFITTPKRLHDLVNFMNQAIHVTLSNKTLSNILEQDARYLEPRSKRITQRIFGTDYYQWHPFIFERLPVFFFHAQNISIYTTLYD